MRRAWLVALVAYVGALLLLASPAAPASDTECQGAPFPFPTFPPDSTLTGTHDNIIVPPGEICVLVDVIVTGNVKALERSRLYILESEVGGNIQGDKARVVQVLDNVIGGNVEIKEGGLRPGDTPDHYEAAVCENEIQNGSIQVEKMVTGLGILLGDPTNQFCVQPNVLAKGDIKINENVLSLPTTVLRVLGNVVGTSDLGGNVQGGNLQVYETRGLVSPKNVENNVVLNGVIQCYDNDTPFVGAPNVGRADPWLGPPFFGPNQCSGTEKT